MTALLIVLAVLLGIGLLPVGVRLLYDGGELALRLKLGPMRAKLLPVKQLHGRKLARQYEKKIKSDQAKLKKRAAKRAQKKKKKQDDKQKPKEQLALERQERKRKKPSLSELLEMVRLALDVAGKLPRKLMMSELYLHIICGGADAAQTAISYGRVWAAVGSALPVLRKAFRIRREDVGVYFDYERDSMDISARMDVQVRVGAVVLLTFGAGVRFLRLLLNNLLQRKLQKKEG